MLAYALASGWGLVGVLVQNALVGPNPPVAVAAGVAVAAVVVTTIRARAR